MQILTTFLLLCATVVTQSEKVITDFNQFSAGHSDLYLLPRNIASPDQKFLYMTCNATADGEYSEFICKVTLEEMKGGPRKQCNIDHLVPMDRSLPLVNDFFTIIERMDNKVVFQLPMVDGTEGHSSLDAKYATSRKIIIIDMDNCTNHHLEFPVGKNFNEIYHYEVVLYNDRFDIYVDSKELCGDFKLCILKYNYNGELMGKPMNFSTEYSSLISVISTPVNRFHPEKGSYSLNAIFWSEDGELKVTHVNDKGTHTKLFGFPLTKVHSIDEWNQYIKMSNDYEFITLCHRKGRKYTEVRCIQYDMMGHKVMNTTIEIEKKQRMVNVFNLRQGGVGFVYQNDDDSSNHTFLHVKMVAQNGHAMEHFLNEYKITYECKAPFTDRIVDHLEIDSKHCFYFSCTEKDTTGEIRFKYTIKCIEEKKEN